jgi:hypothetical protein
MLLRQSILICTSNMPATVLYTTSIVMEEGKKGVVFALEKGAVHIDGSWGGVDW